MNLDVPEAAIAAIEKSRNVPTSIEWTAPRDGIVLERNAIEGMRVQPGGVLFRIADHSVVWALIDVAGARSRRHRDRSDRHREGPQLSRARVLREDRGDLSGDQQGDPDGADARRYCRTRTCALLHDMYVDAEIDTGSGAPVLAVPESAVIDTGSKQAVLRRQGRGPLRAARRQDSASAATAMSRSARASPRASTVVVSANFLIDAESNLKAALEGLLATREQRHDRAPHRLVGAQPVAGAVRHRLRGRRRHLCAASTCRSTPSPISPTRRSSSTRNIRARRRR